MSSQKRKQQIIAAAAKLIAEKGFEGLRTRDIAERVSINHATVHYHFKDKESVIAAVVPMVTEQIYATDMAVAQKVSGSARDKLAAVIRSNLDQRARFPERFAIVSEFTARANRDRAMAQMLASQQVVWLGRMREFVAACVEGGEFRPNLDINQASLLVITLLQGVHVKLDQSGIELYTQLYRQIEQQMLMK